MGNFDDISPEELRQALIEFAREVLRRQSREELLAAIPELQEELGELRQMLFAYEVRLSRHLGPPNATEPGGGNRPSDRAGDDPVLRESLRVIRDAVQREEDMLLEWEGTPPWDEDDDD
jgi:hypothetical protein